MTKFKLSASVLAVSVLLLSGAVACSADKPTASATASSGSDHDQALKFAKCMREHGVDMPDPGSDGSVTGVGTGTDAPGSLGGSAPAVDLTAGNNGAWDACRKFLPNGGEVRKLTAAEREEAVRYAQCMRAHGVDYPDPSADGVDQGAPVEIGDEAATQRFEAAGRACGVATSPTPAK